MKHIVIAEQIVDNISKRFPSMTVSLYVGNNAISRSTPRHPKGEIKLTFLDYLYEGSLNYNINIIFSEDSFFTNGYFHNKKITDNMHSYDTFEIVFSNIDAKCNKLSNEIIKHMRTVRKLFSEDIEFNEKEIVRIRKGLSLSKKGLKVLNTIVPEKTKVTKKKPKRK
jgi:hypothetical protein